MLRDLALHISNRNNITQRERLLMPRREIGLPKAWERNSDQPFNARIVSIHTGISIIFASLLLCSGNLIFLLTYKKAFQYR